MKQSPIFFATLDPLRGLGIETKHSNFHLICFDCTQVVDMLLEDGVQVFCLEKELGAPITIPRTTRDLLLHPKTQAYLESTSTDTLSIAVFKPTFDIELVLAKTPLGQRRTIVSLNASAILSKKLENKLSFFDLCNENNITHTPAQKMSLHAIHKTIFKTLETDHLVIQFEQGWFGNRTFFLRTPDELNNLKQQFTEREVLVAPFVTGTVLTNNLVVADDNIYQSYPFFQINDDSAYEVQLSRLQGSTIGNVWKDLESNFAQGTSVILGEVQRMTNAIGVLLREKGFRGYAGLDFIISEDNTVYVQELNSRFTASVQMFTLLEQETFGTSLLEEHFDLTNKTTPDTYFQPLHGARVLARNTNISPIRITDMLRNGIYSLREDGTYDFMRPDYRVTDLKDGEFLLFTANENREISPDEEIFQVQTLEIPPHNLTALARTLKKDLLG